MKRNYSPIEVRGRVIHVDECIADMVEKLNELGVKTLGSCCGHGRYPATIVIDMKKGNRMEILNQRIIPRKAKFYRKDSNGFYFIPEAMRC